MLGRAPLAFEVDDWALQVLAGKSMRSVADDIIASLEDESNLAMLDYEQDLGRTSAASEVDSWVGVVAGSSDPETILDADILGSPEGYADRS